MALDPPEPLIGDIDGGGKQVTPISRLDAGGAQTNLPFQQHAALLALAIPCGSPTVSRYNCIILNIYPSIYLSSSVVRVVATHARA